MFKLTVNESHLDRLARIFLSGLLLIAALFWTGGALRAVLAVAAFVVAMTAAAGFCGAYPLLKLNTANGSRVLKPWQLSAALAAIAVALAAGAYTSAFFARKFFLEDFNRMNAPYKQALFETGKANRPAAVSNFDAFITEHAAFAAKYGSSRPAVFWADRSFGADVAKVAGIISSTDALVREGDLALAHKRLEEIRPVYQDLLKRNGFSMLAVYLVDFHDVMEKVLDAANAKDAAAVAVAYAEADAKLKAVEEAANDAEIQAIRANLEAVRAAAAAGDLETLPAKAGELKASFVKVYLKRG
jgi:hypothetical protein